MKRWMTSFLLTALLFSTVLICSFFIPEEKENGLNSLTDSRDSTVSIVQTVQKKKHRKSIPEKKPQKKMERAPEKIVEETTIKNDITKDDIDSNIDEEADNQEESISTEHELTQGEKKNEETYKQYVLKRISSKKIYPLAARTKAQEGKVTLHTVVGIDGQLLVAEIISSCDYEILNEAAINSVKKSSPFKKMSNGKRNLDITFSMEFSLR